MATNEPQRPDHPMYTLLQDENIDEFNRRREAGDDFDTTNLDLRALDLRGLSTRDLDLSGCYLRNTNLAGLDLSDCNLDNASLYQSHVSGTLFPRELDAQEILMSINQGTRLRGRM